MQSQSVNKCSVTAKFYADGWLSRYVFRFVARLVEDAPGANVPGQVLCCGPELYTKSGNLLYSELGITIYIIYLIRMTTYPAIFTSSFIQKNIVDILIIINTWRRSPRIR